MLDDGLVLGGAAADPVEIAEPRVDRRGVVERQRRARDDELVAVAGVDEPRLSRPLEPGRAARAKRSGPLRRAAVPTFTTQ